MIDTAGMSCEEITDLIYDMRKFRTDYKKLSLDFLTYKDQFPLRAEALSFINTILHLQKNNNRKIGIAIRDIKYGISFCIAKTIG